MAGRDAVQPMAGTGSEALMIPQNPILRPPAAPSVGDSLVARSPLLRRLLGKAMAVGYRLSGRIAMIISAWSACAGCPLSSCPACSIPRVPRTGEFFAAQLDSKLVDREWEVLDMGTGSGVCAVFAAKYARRVVAVDINAAAVRCAGINAVLNHLEEKIEVRHGDLFAPVSEERFDLILFNPPFLRGAARNDRDRAWRSSDVAERFAAGLGAHLKSGGSALVLLSTFGDAGHFPRGISRTRS